MDYPHCTPASQCDNHPSYMGHLVLAGAWSKMEWLVNWPSPSLMDWPAKKENKQGLENHDNNLFHLNWTSLSNTLSHLNLTGLSTLLFHLNLTGLLTILSHPTLPFMYMALSGKYVLPITWHHYDYYHLDLTLGITKYKEDNKIPMYWRSKNNTFHTWEFYCLLRLYILVFLMCLSIPPFMALQNEC